MSRFHVLSSNRGDVRRTEKEIEEPRIHLNFIFKQCKKPMDH